MTGADKAIDGDSATKWFDSARAPLVVQLASSAEVEAKKGEVGSDFLVGINRFSLKKKTNRPTSNDTSLLPDFFVFWK